MRLLVRTDGDAAIGTGHVVRSLALAQAWLRHGDVTLAAARLAPRLASRAHMLGVDVEKIAPGADHAQELAAMAARLDARAVVLDGYHLPPGLQTACPQVPTMLIDDHARTGWHGATAVLDGNLGAGKDAYPATPARLAGPRYALLRPSFAQRPPDPADGPPDTATHGRTPGGGILVSLGGGASPQLVRIVLRGLAPIQAKKRMDVSLVLGATQTDQDGLATAARKQGCTVHIDVPDIAPLLRAHAVAFVAAGTTILEAAATGTPVLALSQADNQRPVLEQVVTSGLGRSLGPASGLTPSAVTEAVQAALADLEWRAAAAAAGPALVDGRGARRAATWLRSRILTLRPARPDDADMVRAWANDPTTRQMSFRPAPITADEHSRWWQERSQDPETSMFIAEHDGPLGFLWFRGARRRAEVSVNVAPERRGEGWGPAMVRAATDRIFAERPVDVVLAWTRPGNLASRSAFLDADYDSAPPVDPPVAGACLFKRRRGG